MTWPKNPIVVLVIVAVGLLLWQQYRKAKADAYPKAVSGLTPPQANQGAITA